MRILLLVEGFNALGGIAEIVESLAVEFSRSGHQVAIASTRDRRAAGNVQERARRGGSECHYFQIRNRRPISFRHPEPVFRNPYEARFGALARLVANWRPEIVCSALTAWDRYPTIASVCTAAGVPLVQCFHVTDERGRGRLGGKGLRALSGASFVAGSAATRDFFSRLLPQIESARVIIGGVDPEAAAGAAPHARSRPYVLCACRLQLKHKAVDVLIDAFGRIAAEFPELDLLIAGGGEDRARIDGLIATSAVGGRILMLGVQPRDQMWALHKGAQLFALPSRPGECMPVVYLEALAAGTAVIGTDTGGARELIRDGVNGFLVREEDAGALAGAMRAALRDAPQSRAMGERGREIVLANYAWPICASRYLELFESIIRAPAGLRTAP